jgi:hypothetical protein
MSQVPLKRTPVAMSDYARGLIRAWHKLLGVVPTKQAAGVLWAQYMLETGGPACWNWNLGNVKVTQAQVDAGVHWHDLPGTWEIVNGKKVVLPDGDKGRRFRAFGNIDEAMEHHLAFLRNKRYRTSWPAVEAGDCMQFARLLKAAGYFTASAEDYGNGMLRHFRAWMASVVYENAVGDLLAELDAPTVPVLVVDVENFKVVHPAVPLGRPLLDGDLPANDDDPDAA